MGDARDLHGAGHFAIGGDGRAAHEGGKEAGETVAQHRAMESGILHKVFLGHCANDIDVADMLDDGGDGHRDHEDEGLPGELRQLEVGDHRGQGKPGGRGYGREVDKAHAEGNDIADDNADDDGHQFDKAATEHEHEDGADERDEGQEPVLLSHIDGCRRERKADKDDHRADDNGREQRVEQLAPLPLDEGRHEEVDQCDARDAGDGARHAPLLGGRDNRRDEGEAAAKEDGHLALGDQMEEERADTGGKERGSGIEADKQRHQYRGAESYEEELDADDGLARGGEFLCHNPGFRSST